FKPVQIPLPPYVGGSTLWKLRWVVIELNVPVFSEDGKVEMAGSGSEHEFPRCDGHGGADFADTKDVKKPTGEAGFFTVTLQS
ncbi:hypothetical protein RNQ11_22070, partial [Escherichia coli]|nr:hypothetical protein [Escherichia coli]